MGLREALTGGPSWVRWLLVPLLVRLAMLPVIPILPEEAYHWNFARHLDWGYYDHPPMIAWAIAAGRAVFGDNPLGIRAVTILFSLGTTALLARLAKRFYGESAAVWAVILFTFMPVALPVAAAGFPDSPLFFFWALTMTLVWEAIEGQEGWRWLAAGAALGAAMLSKYTAIFLVLSVFLYLILTPRYRRWLATPWPYLAGVVALLVFSPVIYWNWKHEWASFLFQSKGRLQESQGFRPRYAFQFFWVQLLASFALTVPLLVATIVRMVRSTRSEEKFYLSLLVPMVATFWAISFFRPSHILWPMPAYLGLVVVMAGTIAEGGGKVADFYGRQRRAFLAISGLGLAAFGFHLAWFLPFFDPIQGPYGWKEVAVRAREVRSGLPASAFYLALGRKYTVASQLAYHLDQPYDVHGAHLIGEPALQYGYWCRPSDIVGRDAAIVLDDVEVRSVLDMAKLKRSFDTLTPVGTVTVPIGRSTLRQLAPLQFHVYVGRGYRPPRPD